MKKHSFLFLLILAVFVVETKAQTINGVPFQSIEQRLLADTSIYSGIAGRFHQGDSTLTADEMTLLYYGSVLRPDFNPYQESRVIKAGNSLSRRGKHEDALRLFDNLLSKHPASMSGWLEKSFALWEADQKAESDAVYSQFLRLMQVPLSTGSGESFDSAIVVRMVEDEELILIEKGYVATEPKLITRQGQRYHMVPCLQKGDANVQKTFYFNVQLPLEHGVQQSLKKNRGN
jgi:tetratricopeptide (TPR) repeat protein